MKKPDSLRKRGSNNAKYADNEEVYDELNNFIYPIIGHMEKINGSEFEIPESYTKEDMIEYFNMDIERRIGLIESDIKYLMDNGEDKKHLTDYLERFDDINEIRDLIQHLRKMIETYRIPENR